MKQGWAAHYLLNGYGKENEMESGVSFKTIQESSVFKSQPIATTFDDLGMLLVFLDPRLLPVETVWNASVKSPLDEQLRTVRRASYLQQIGIVPKDIDLGQFVQNASFRGSSESMILFSLLLRGGIKLRDEAIASAVTSGMQATLRRGPSIVSGSFKHGVQELSPLPNPASDEKHRNRFSNLKIICSRKNWRRHP